MLKLVDQPVYLSKGKLVTFDEFKAKNTVSDDDYKKTMAYKIMSSHNVGEDDSHYRIKFDALASHDITYVGIIQTAKASGLKEFPIPYVLTNCHNSLCAVGGTINEDDHLFGLSAAKKYGGIFVPANEAVIHSYMREMFAAPYKMILGSDSHTRYGALGTMAIGEGGPELVKQLLNRTYDINRPEVIAIYMTGKPKKGVGPQDVALAIIKAVFKCGFVKNKVMEFIGDGISNLSVEYRNAIDVMTTETTCLSSIWKTDDAVKEYLSEYLRADEYKEVSPDEGARYDGAVYVELDKIEPMIALPFHPSNAFTIKELNENALDILRECEIECQKQIGDRVVFNLTDKIVGKKVKVSQGVVAGCSGGTYDNLCQVASILEHGKVGSDAFALSIYPGSQPTMLKLVENGAVAKMIKSGAIVKPAFCGPCFGAGDVPCNNGLSIRHTTRNFMSREGSKPGEKQIASVALMDARSIAATAINGGYLTPATEVDFDETVPKFTFDKTIYENRVYNGFKKADGKAELVYGPNIADWPTIEPLKDNLAMKVVAVINDPVTTTDELIPSGETSSYRSNPLRLAEFALSRKVPEYVQRAKAVKKENKDILEGKINEQVEATLALAGVDTSDLSYGSVIYAVKPGDGSAREQAASCQRVLGGVANLASEYATKRYRSNLINWGMIPFLTKDIEYNLNDVIVVKDVAEKLKRGDTEFEALLVREDKVSAFKLYIDPLTDDEKDIILKGCLINYYA